MNKILFLVLLSMYLYFPNSALAHGGGLNSEGCHNCYVGACAGEYHCHRGGGGSGGGGGSRTPSILNMPKTDASTIFEPNESGGFTVIVDWQRPDGGQWSIGLSKVAGADPGPLTDTTTSDFKFENVKPGKYYINIKEGMPNGYWSNVAYWTVEVPTWYKPIPSSSPYSPAFTVKTPAPQTSAIQDNDNVTAYIILAALVGGAYWINNKEKPPNS